MVSFSAKLVTAPAMLAVLSTTSSAPAPSNTMVSSLAIVPATSSVAPAARVISAASVLSPVSVQVAPGSTMTWVKLTYWLPRSRSVPAPPLASSNVLEEPAPPSTVPPKVAPGSTITRLARPAPIEMASTVPPM